MCPTIYAVVAGVDASFGEPGDVALLETPTPDRLEVAMPVQKISRLLQALVPVI